MLIPVPDVSGEPQQRSMWFGLAGVFSIFAFLSLITMENYSMTGASPSIRKDARLFGAITVQRVKPSTDDLLTLLRSATNVNLTADGRLISHQPDYGLWDLKGERPWAVMELLARQQTVPARWEKTTNGYSLVMAAPFGKSKLFWFGGTTLLALSMMGLRWQVVNKEQMRLSCGETGKGRTLVAALLAAKG